MHQGVAVGDVEFGAVVETRRAHVAPVGEGLGPALGKGGVGREGGGQADLALEVEGEAEFLGGGAGRLDGGGVDETVAFEGERAARAGIFAVIGLCGGDAGVREGEELAAVDRVLALAVDEGDVVVEAALDRKSTRLNSSH